MSKFFSKLVSENLFEDWAQTLDWLFDDLKFSKTRNWNKGYNQKYLKIKRKEAIYMYFISMLLMLLILIICIHRKQIIDDLKEYKKNKSNMRKRKKDIANGRWHFPCLDFYQECQKEKVTEITDSLCVKKMMLIAKNILVKEKIPEEYLHFYYGEDIVKNYYRTAKSQIQLENKKRQELLKQKKESEDLKKITPQIAKLNPEEKEYIELQKELKDLFFAEKRKTYLSFLINQTKQKISNKEEAEKRLEALPTAILQSTNMKKENDWALLGGIAEGIAGPAAGAAVATNAMIENQKIKSENERNFKRNLELATEIGISSQMISHKFNTNGLKIKLRK